MKIASPSLPEFNRFTTVNLNLFNRKQSTYLRDFGREMSFPPAIKTLTFAVEVTEAVIGSACFRSAVSILFRAAMNA